MERFKGTKGRWTVITWHEGGRGYKEYVEADINGRYQKIASLFMWSYKEARANAQLISKAPEMLKMLVDIANGRVISTKNVEDLINEATNIKGL